MKLAWPALSTLLALAGIALIPTAKLMLENPRVFAAKNGTVVDSQDGSGMSGVYVIAIASAEWQTLNGSGSSRVLYRHVTKTDSRGKYSIPSDWLSAPPWYEPYVIAKPTIDWSITAFKLGYIIVGDGDGLSLDHNGETLSHPDSTQKAPTGVMMGASMQVDTIKMRSAAFTEQQMATYYGAIISSRSNSRREISTQPDEVAMRRQVYDALAPRLCALPRDLLIAWSIDSFVSDPNGFADQLAVAEPAAIKRAIQIGAAPAIHAGIECDLLKTKAENAPY